MQFTQIFAVAALAFTSVQAMPEPAPVTPVAANATVQYFSDAASTVVIGASALDAADVATVQALVETMIESAESDAAAVAASIAAIIGAGEIYAAALENLLTSLSACVYASG